MNLSWFLYYGRKLGMGKREILCTRFGEMMDMISCDAVYRGAAMPKQKVTLTNYDDVFSLR